MKQTTGRLRALTPPEYGGDLWWCYGEWWWRYGCLRWLIGKWSRAVRKMRSWRWSLNVGAEHGKQLVDAEISVWILPKKVSNSITITVYVVILITYTTGWGTFCRVDKGLFIVYHLLFTPLTLCLFSGKFLFLKKLS